MFRFFRRRLAFDLAATLLVVLGAVSVVDIDDYGVHRRALCPDIARSAPASADARDSAALSDSEADPDHACACLLCTVVISAAPGLRVLPPSAGTLSRLLPGDIADSPHPPEVFHPPSA